MMVLTTDCALAASDSCCFERDMMAIRLPRTIIVKSGKARSTTRMTSSTGPRTATGSSSDGMVMILVVVTKEPLTQLAVHR